MIEFGFGMLFVLEFLYLLFFWQTATFRADRDPQLVELLNDMAWIPFVGLTVTAAVQVAVFGVAILMDRRPTPVFPRWLGYCNLWDRRPLRSQDGTRVGGIDVRPAGSLRHCFGGKLTNGHSLVTGTAVVTSTPRFTGRAGTAIGHEWPCCSGLVASGSSRSLRS
jgi:hypothetical protein